MNMSLQIILLVTGDTLKAAWSNLRNYFFNTLKRCKTKSGQAALKIGKWKYEKEIEFLLPYVETRQTHTNLSEQHVKCLPPADKATIRMKLCNLISEAEVR